MKPFFLLFLSSPNLESRLAWHCSAPSPPASLVLNKGDSGHLRISWSDVVRLLLVGRGGKGRSRTAPRSGKYGSVRGGGLSGVKSRWHVHHRLVSLSLVLVCWRKVFNLKAGVPVQMPSRSGMVGFQCFVPSGAVLGGAGVGHAWMKLGGDGARLDRVLQFRSEVLYANSQGLFVIFFIFEDLSVICNSTQIHPLSHS
jgi:hypothetical protein